MAVIVAMNVIQEKAVVMVKIHVNKDNVNVKTMAKPTIFFSIIGRSLVY